MMFLTKYESFKPWYMLYWNDTNLIFYENINAVTTTLHVLK